MDRKSKYFILITVVTITSIGVNICVYDGWTFRIDQNYVPSFNKERWLTTKIMSLHYMRTPNIKATDKRGHFNHTLSRRDHTSFNQRLVHSIENHYPHYFVSRPVGRLGNQMFEFALSLGIARTLNYTHVVRPSHPLLNYFNITELANINVTNTMSISEGQWRNKKWRNNKTYFDFNLTCNGYFQSWHFFENSSDVVRRSLTIKADFKDQAKKFLDTHIHEDNKTLIGIHIRRGDFLNGVQKKLGRVVASVLYFETAKTYFRQKYKDPVFVVISNDMKWCKENIADNNTIFSIFKKPIIDMALMTLCHHVIISSGTFSWWVGWFCSGNVVYMKDHPRPGSPISKQPKYTEGFYLPTWIGMSNS